MGRREPGRQAGRKREKAVISKERGDGESGIFHGRIGRKVVVAAGQ